MHFHLYMPPTLGLQTTVGRWPSWHDFISLGLYCLKDSELFHCSRCTVARPTITGTSDLCRCISSCLLYPLAGSRIQSYIHTSRHQMRSACKQLPIMYVLSAPCERCEGLTSCYRDSRLLSLTTTSYILYSRIFVVIPHPLFLSITLRMMETS